MKKSIILLLMVLVIGVSRVSAIELGVLGGRVSNPGHLVYGFSGGTGLFIPLLKLEVEYCRLTKAEDVLQPNTCYAGVKIRPKFGAFSPYVVAGVGMDFERFNLHFSEHQKFSFIGGGLHYYIAGMFSLRGDIRILNYKDGNRTRISGGIFIHF